MEEKDNIIIGVEKAEDKKEEIKNTINTRENTNKEEIKNTSNSRENTYKTVSEVKTTTKKNNYSFGKSVVVPFISGVLGAALVVGTCFGVPNIRELLIETPSSSGTPIVSSPISSTPNKEINTDLISLKEYSETGVAVAAKVLPSVVGITVEFPVSSIFSMNTSTTSAEGSGIIISEDGYILTNNHIVSSSSSSSYYYEVGEASKVTIYLYNNDKGYEGTIVGTDEQTDLAVIKIDATDLTAADLGDSDGVQVGEFAMAVGNPLGMQSSVSAGTISAVNRKVTNEGKTYTLIQTDTAINSGNSGGALVNSKGQVIGINTMKFAGTGIEGMGFAIPINSAKPIYQQLIEYQKVKRPTIGITGRDLTEELAKANNLVVGIYVVSISEFSAAEKAGVKPGDVIIAVNGTSVKTMDELNEIKNRHSIGETIILKVNRNGEEKDIEIILQEQ